MARDATPRPTFKTPLARWMCYAEPLGSGSAQFWFRALNTMIAPITTATAISR
jgi:hypothetical protein